MKINLIWILIPFILFFLSGCLAEKNDNSSEKGTDNLILNDKSRNRIIPVALYFPDSVEKAPVVIFSHGYGANMEKSNEAYSYLTNYLASHGYFVASIQHELSTDELLPAEGNPRVVRMPNWERGVQNILFVINELKRIKPEPDYDNIILIGHSNGGDMSMLFAQKYPEMIDKVISLDNRRMPLPKTDKPKIYSLRSSDQSADEGVLPSEEEQEKFDIKIINLKNTPHTQMDDSGSPVQKEEINKYTLNFLNE